MRRKWFRGFDPDEVEAVDPTPKVERFRKVATTIARAQLTLLKYTTDDQAISHETYDRLVTEQFPTYEEDVDRAMREWHEKRDAEKADVEKRLDQTDGVSE